MKKTIKLFAILAVLLFAASCQNSELDNGQTINDGKLTLTATIALPEQTRVTYDTSDPTVITPSWTIGDKIIGFDNQNQKFTFEVTAVDGSGRATLDDGGYTPGPATRLYAIYAPGKNESNIIDNKLAVDLGSQSGELNDDSPVLMCATAEINAGSATLKFENQTAIIGVTKFKLPNAGNLTSISVDGLTTAGTFEVSGDKLVLTPAATSATATATGSWATGAGNICETAIYFATLPTTAAKIALRASDGVNDYGNLASIEAADIAAGNYYYMQKSLGAPVADVNGVKYGNLADAWTVAKNATTDVTITLLADCTHNSQIDFGNANNKTITLDLNGKVLTTSTAKFITSASSSKSLIIKDTGSPKGKITSSAANIIYLTKHSLSVELDGSIIESSMAASEDNADAALYVKAENTPRPQITLDNGARVYTKNAVTTIYSYYGVYTLNECEITSGSTKTGGRYCIFASTGAQIEVNDDASLYSTETSGTFSAIHSGSGNSATSIVINGGHFYGKYSLTAGNSGGYSSRMTINGGYFVNDISNYSGSSSATINGTIEVSSESHTHQTTGDPLNYGYEFQAPAADVAEVNGVGYKTFAAALDAAINYNGGDDVVTLTLEADISHNTVETLVNSAGKDIVLELNNKTLSTSTAGLIKSTANTLTIQNGTITSTAINVINKTGEGTININNCTISSSAVASEGTDAYYNEGVIRMNNSNSTINISNNSKIFSTDALTAVANISGVLTIRDSEVSSGLGDEKTGYIAVCTYSGTTTINSGCFYSNNTNSTRPAIYVGSAGRVTINDGYFYSESTRSVRGIAFANTANITVKGGYFNKALSFTTSGTTYSPTIPAGYTVKTGADGSFNHSVKGSLSFSYQVEADSGEAEAQASTSTPVASYGAARTGGVSF